jgi:hypothetical protein
MRGTAFFGLLAALVAIATALPASAQSTQQFKAQFHDSSPTCPPGTDLCGKGLLKGFGAVTSTLTFTSVVPGPGASCVSGTADRVVTLDSDGSTLRLAVVGTICDQKVAGTFEIVGGSGAFAGATGGGTLWGSTNGSDSVHYRGTITLA